MENILVCDDEDFLRNELARILTEEGYAVTPAALGQEALRAVERDAIDLVLLDLNLPDMHGLEVLREIKARQPDLLVIVVTGYGSVESAVESLKSGAYDYIKKPFKADAIKLIVKLALETQKLRRRVRALQEREFGAGEIFVANDPAMLHVLNQLGDVASHPETTVLITGESGTGKEVAARYIHSHSERSQGPFLEINCAAIPGPILESELFGHEQGAFTDAKRAKEGLLEAAGGGTVFLDEVGDMDLNLQAKLLRFLETRKIRRLGGIREIPIDVRVIGATNRDLKEWIREKNFREDLYYRLSVFPVNIPPLRERREDIIPLSVGFLSHFTKKFKKATPEISYEVATLLTNYNWPGNVRELKNLMERLAITCKSASLTLEHLPLELRDRKVKTQEQWFLPPDGLNLEALEQELAKSLIAQALARTQGNVSKAAKLLDMPRGTLRHRMANLNLKGEEGDEG